jgi:DNA-binding NarL/FixJ family response regulator
MINHVAAHAVIHEAATIREAVRIFAETAPHLALVDVVLGDEDGIRCVRQLKAFSPTARIVLISAYPDREFHRSGLEAGAVAFLDKKDLDAAALRQVIADIGD